MTKNRGATPFEQDATLNSGYRYTTNAAQSCAVANKRLTEVSFQWLKKQKRISTVLDLGCGDGSYTAALAKSLPRLRFAGGEPAKTAIRIAQKKYKGVQFFVCDLLDEKSLRRRHADAIILRGVIHHLPEPARGLRHALQCGERMLIIEPNGWNFIVKIIEHTSRYHREHGEQSFTSWKLRNWLRQNGAQVERTYYVGLVPFFCPEVLIPILLWLQPFVERSFLARLLCGQVVIEAFQLRE